MERDREIKRERARKRMVTESLDELMCERSIFSGIIKRVKVLVRKSPFLAQKQPIRLNKRMMESGRGRDRDKGTNREREREVREREDGYRIAR